MLAPRPASAVSALSMMLATYACVGDDPVSGSSSGTTADGGSSSGGSSGTSGGTDAATCDAPKTTCGSNCVDLQADDAHCGTCENACAGTKCFNGVCDGARVKQVSVGAGVACAVRVDGSVWCWGLGAQGAFGEKFEGPSVGTDCIGTPATYRCSPTPRKVPNLPPVDSISVGYESVCAVTKSKEVWCWGRNANGEAGNAAATTTCEAGACVVPAAKIANVPANVTQVTIGFAHACALLLSGEVWCWGDSTQGRLGRGNLTVNPDAAPVVGLPKASAISTSGDANGHTCALSGGRAWCWGANTNLALGYTTSTSDCDGSATCSHTPKQATEIGTPLSTADLAQIATGNQHTCVRTGTGDVFCWGYHGYKAGTVGGAPSLIARAVDTGVAALAGRLGHGCVLKNDKTIKCWGQADGARLGTILPATSCVATVPWSCNDGAPSSVNFSDAIMIDASDNSIALRNDGKIFAWGWNRLGMLGKTPGTMLKTCGLFPSGTSTCSDVPVEVVLP